MTQMVFDFLKKITNGLKNYFTMLMKIILNYQIL